MTDKEKLSSLLTEFGVGFKENAESIECHEGDTKIEGYLYFLTRFVFDKNGKFIKMGAWE